MRILVTGGKGYIGSVVCNNLRAKHEISDFAGYNITKPEEIAKALSEFKPDIVVHLAALANIRICNENPQKCHEINFEGTKNLLEAMEKLGHNKLIFASSAAVYKTSNTPLKEDNKTMFSSPYGKSKLEAENIINSYNSINSICFRFFNAAGASLCGNYGEKHKPETHLIPIAIAAAMFPDKELAVFGTDYNTPDGTAIRDYLHVEDISAAIELGIAYLSSYKTKDVFNLGSGTGYSVKQVIAKIEELTGKKVKCKYSERRSGDAERLLADITKAEKVLGWTPKYSDLDKIIKTAYSWHCKNQELLQEAV